MHWHRKPVSLVKETHFLLHLMIVVKWRLCHRSLIDTYCWDKLMSRLRASLRVPIHLRTHQLEDGLKGLNPSKYTSLIDLRPRPIVLSISTKIMRKESTFKWHLNENAAQWTEKSIYIYIIKVTVCVCACGCVRVCVCLFSIGGTLLDLQCSNLAWRTTSTSGRL